MLAIEILAILLLGYFLARAEVGLRKSLHDIDDMPLPAGPYDDENEQVWFEIAGYRCANPEADWITDIAAEKAAR